MAKLLIEQVHIPGPRNAVNDVCCTQVDRDWHGIMCCVGSVYPTVTLST